MVLITIIIITVTKMNRFEYNFLFILVTAVKNGQLNFVNGYSIYKDVNFSKNKYCILRFDMVDYRTIEVSQNGDCDFDNYVNVSGRYRR